uniref:Reverse transcriptase n=1 Tax=Cannabis sativa TaxID=3483 RepID=A0A803PH75_CANSA
MKCISMTSISFLINGAITGEIKPTRGLRQGDPLSLYLFILCAKGGLSSLLRAKQESNILKAFLKDKVTSVLQSWHSKCFSKAGKEVLLKAVVQAIPVYAMSCFCLPIKLCKKIEAPMARFWWGSSGDSRKVHWKNWQSVCHSKFVGGLSFHSLIHFNQVMLAKQAWRIFSQPNSLLSLTLKAIYFPNTSILDAKPGHNLSFSWCSILWGKDLLVSRLIWKICDEEEFRTLADHWLPTNKFKYPIRDLDSSQNTLSYFINQPSCWNLDRLNTYFDECTVNDILNVPISGIDGKDYLIYGKDSSGLFSVKSAYHLALSGRDVPYTSSFQSSKFFWSKALLNQRNNALYKRTIIPPNEVFAWCSNFLLQYLDAQQKSLAATGAQVEDPPALFDCSAGSFRDHTDATTDKERRVYSLSVIAFNKSNQSIAGIVKPFRGSVSPTLVEAKAL